MKQKIFTVIFLAITIASCTQNNKPLFNDLHRHAIKGSPKSITELTHNGSTINDSIISRIVMSFNTEGFMTKNQFLGDMNRPIKQAVFNYSDDILVCGESLNAEGVVTNYSEFGFEDGQCRSEFIYSSDSVLLRTRGFDYNKDGYLQSESASNAQGQLLYTIEYQHDKDNNRTIRTDKNSQGNIIAQYSFSYDHLDSAGNWTVRTTTDMLRDSAILVTVRELEYYK